MATVRTLVRRGGLEATNRPVGPTTVAFIGRTLHVLHIHNVKRMKVTDEIIQLVNEEGEINKSK